jgi:adenine-specific DNA methylase
MTMEDIRFEGKAQRLSAMLTAVVVNGSNGKEYQLPTQTEISLATEAALAVDRVFRDLPFGKPSEPTPAPAGSKFNSSSTRIYGLYEWKGLFTQRQLLTLATFAKHTREACAELLRQEVTGDWHHAVTHYLATAVDRLADRGSTICTLVPSREIIGHTFTRFALPITWDFAESVAINDASGGYPGAIDWIVRFVEHAMRAARAAAGTTAKLQSGLQINEKNVYDAIVTDPPYYDAISYADLMDFFYVWLRRTVFGVSNELNAAFRDPVSPKWSVEKDDGELIDNPTLFDGDKTASRAAYERGTYRAFEVCDRALVPDGRMVVVFANKNPDAWEALVSAIVRAGFVVDGSWPTQTERGNRTRALSSAALASSVWLACRKRSEAARPGWDNLVLEEMRQNIYKRLREYWDSGIRGPDFVWAATGPALEAYSKHPVVKKADAPGALMEVSEFLRAVRRIVVDFVVGRVLTHDGEAAAVSGLDDVTTYYLLHRHDFGMDDAPIGACILYAISCGLSDHDLADRYEILQRTGGQSEPDEDEESESANDDGNGEQEGTGSKVRLRPWNKRVRKSMGYDGEGKLAPLIDQVHRLMHLWRAGDVIKVDEYVQTRALKRNALFHQLLQALIELASPGSEERALLESVSNHISSRPASAEERQREMFNHGNQR